MKERRTSFARISARKAASASCSDCAPGNGNGRRRRMFSGTVASMNASSDPSSPRGPLRWHPRGLKSRSLAISFGSALAIAISWSVNKSVLWAILHGILSWFYVIYYIIVR
jgi:hypothetical protein